MNIPPAKPFPNLIDGDWKTPTSSDVMENRNPANRDELVGLFPKATREDARNAIAAARAALPGRKPPPPHAGQFSTKPARSSSPGWTTSPPR
jgi:acyl-CoA reductase-like NAD-dependent aldehyde dehydrogenase